MSIKDLFSIIAEKVKFDLTVKKKQLEKEHNIELGKQILSELQCCLHFHHFYLLNYGITEEIRGVDFSDNILTIGIPKTNFYRDYEIGMNRKILEKLNRFLVGFQETESNRIGFDYFRQCYPHLPRLQFLTVYDRGVELIATVKLN